MTPYEKFIVDLMVDLGALYKRTDYDPRKEARRMTVEWGKKLEEFMKAKPEGIELQVLEHIKTPLQYSADLQLISDSNHKMVAQIRGWGHIQYKTNPEDIQDAMGLMLVKAFNEKYSLPAENDSSNA